MEDSNTPEIRLTSWNTYKTLQMMGYVPYQLVQVFCPSTVSIHIYGKEPPKLWNDNLVISNFVLSDSSLRKKKTPPAPEKNPNSSTSAASPKCRSPARRVSEGFRQWPLKLCRTSSLLADSPGQPALHPKGRHIGITLPRETSKNGTHSKMIHGICNKWHCQNMFIGIQSANLPFHLMFLSKCSFMFTKPEVKQEWLECWSVIS